jgi:hypothetical protein
LQDATRGTRFEDDESVIRAVRTWLREQETSWHREGMHALVSRWCKAIDLDGDYVEKSHVYRKHPVILCMNFILSSYFSKSTSTSDSAMLQLFITSWALLLQDRHMRAAQKVMAHIFVLETIYSERMKFIHNITGCFLYTFDFST